MRVLVTGGSGFVGSHTVAALRRAGHQVRLLVRSPERVPAAIEPLGVTGVEAAPGDITDRAAVERALAGCDAVVHGAAVYSFDPRKEATIRAVNVAGTETVIGAAVRRGLDPIIYVSSYLALAGRRGATLRADDPVGDPGTVYGASKAAAEVVARRYQALGAPVATTYPSGVFGPHDPNMGENTEGTIRMLNGRTPLLPRGGTPVTDVRDLAELHLRLLKPGLGPRRYIAPAQSASVRDLVLLLSLLTGRPLPTTEISIRPVLPVLRLTDALHRLTGLPMPGSYGLAYTLTLNHQVDATPAERELGVTARPLAATLTDTVRWLVQTGHVSRELAGDLAA